MKTIKYGLMVILFLAAQSVWAHTLHVKIHYVGPTEGSTWLGLQQGLDEANLQGEFLGQEYEIVPITLAAAETAHINTALLIALSVEDILAVAALPHLAEVPIINVQSKADSLRTACMPNLLHTPVSNKMQQDALAQWLAKEPDSKAQPQGWHHTFRKFAASQLNGRFKKSHNVDMDDNAWASWAAVKVLSDTVARLKDSEASVVLPFLRNEIAFDGQKGVGSTFRETGQLRQILLLVEEDKIVAEAPIRGTTGGLDSLGLVSCTK
jgi:ABC-type branched-subunit amino acid transport system substrate-binding protein